MPIPARAVLPALVLPAALLAAALAPILAVPAQAAPAPVAAAPTAPADTSLARPDSTLGHATMPSGEDQETILIGRVSRAEIVALHPEWATEQQDYQPEPSAIAALRAVDRDVDIVCVLGTWCSDSAREVPHFWKVLQEAKNPHLELTMLAVGRKADAEQAAAKLREVGFTRPIRQAYAVELVPTFIFYRLGEEIGRIVETPEVSPEADAAAILSVLGEEPPR